MRKRSGGWGLKGALCSGHLRADGLWGFGMRQAEIHKTHTTLKPQATCSPGFSPGAGPSDVDGDPGENRTLLTVAG